jgi:predicted DNA-binding protein with PD1-like motif
MQSKFTNQSPRKFTLTFDDEEDLIEGLTSFVVGEKIDSATFSADGVFQELVLGFYDFERKMGTTVELHKPIELVCLAGRITLKSGVPEVHAHLVVSGPDGVQHGGYLIQGRTRPAMRVTLTESSEDTKWRDDSVEKPRYAGI